MTPVARIGSSFMLFCAYVDGTNGLSDVNGKDSGFRASRCLGPKFSENACVSWKRNGSKKESFLFEKAITPLR